jgi:small neutral amino acid transporter SnatA (MarC family)
MLWLAPSWLSWGSLSVHADGPGFTAMGVTAQNSVLRLSGILLAAVAMQFVFDGLAASGLLAASK